MPELPEVESIRRSILPHVVGIRVATANLYRRDVLVAPGDPPGGFARQRSSAQRPKPVRVRPEHLLEGALITGVERRGKQLALIAELDGGGGGRALVVQLGMSGQFLHRAPGQELPDASHVHAEWMLKRGRRDAGRLVFRDPRRFGGLRAFATTELWTHWNGELGPDALLITPEQLAAAVAGSRRPVKALLLDQAALAGVGNIYADEALFKCGIRPDREAARLKPPEIVRLADEIRQTLAWAVEAGGSTLRSYVDADGNPGTFQLQHAVYGRGGEPCPRCGRTLRSGMLAQRTTVWCMGCQV